ncbi:enterochelin esterase-like enzyme [Kitasatospora sp. MAP12-15]|uniref:alpha/beta hydrolase n=1 Tax=unclassified Kitasatospora TaxID=2633591 RepID=UPI002475CCDE|nr:alpha/beta hydrolase-fold protein [Kitasatospora sp. MAP12-44]MDH6114141.1 enterochelin esterase-like enzyme [Kitasatospora sp. MAP12-44]
MQLTGTPFLILTIILVPVSIAVAMLLWGRVGGPKPVQALARLIMLLFCQATAVTMVFVMVNNANIIYGSWDDLLGDGSHVRAVPVPPGDALGGQGGTSGDAKAAKVLQQFKSVGDPVVPADVQTTELKGRLSGVDGEVLVWLPPQYNDPAYKDKNFPVVELLPGFPGSSKTWFGTLDVSEQLKPLMQSGEVAPFILVSPRTLLLGNDTDTGCADVPGKVNADTWLSRDVPQMILDNFRADPSSDRWAVAGYSAGAHCADRLALEHPNRYRAAVSMSGYNDPGEESKSLTAKDPQLKETANPLYILTHAQTPPKVALYQTGNKGDGYESGEALAKAAKAPTTVTLVETSGPHSGSVWKPLVPDVFKWLTTIIPIQH